MRLKADRLQEKITHVEIARRAGTSQSRVTAILNDDLEYISSDLLIRILAFLNYRAKAHPACVTGIAFTHAR
jgi:transcriptional regulator with XRE-family HTH domain